MGSDLLRAWNRCQFRADDVLPSPLACSAETHASILGDWEAAHAEGLAWGSHYVRNPSGASHCRSHQYPAMMVFEGI